MWDFLSEVIKNLGVASAAAAATVILYAVTVRELWRKNLSLHQQLFDEASRCMHRLDELQEKRVADAQRVTERVVHHVAEIDHAMEKLTAAVDAIMDRRRP